MAFNPKTKIVILAKAGIQTRVQTSTTVDWIPAFAGMTKVGS